MLVCNSIQIYKKLLRSWMHVLECDLIFTACLYSRSSVPTDNLGLENGVVGVTLSLKAKTLPNRGCTRWVCPPSSGLRKKKNWPVAELKHQGQSPKENMRLPPDKDTNCLWKKVSTNRTWQCVAFMFSVFPSLGSGSLFSIELIERQYWRTSRILIFLICEHDIDITFTRVWRKSGSWFKCTVPAGFCDQPPSGGSRSLNPARPLKQEAGCCI